VKSGFSQLMCLSPALGGRRADTELENVLGAVERRRSLAITVEYAPHPRRHRAAVGRERHATPADVLRRARARNVRWIAGVLATTGESSKWSRRTRGGPIDRRSERPKTRPRGLCSSLSQHARTTFRHSAVFGNSGGTGRVSVLEALLTPPADDHLKVNTQQYAPPPHASRPSVASH
jgi:hypothetical protein